MRIGSSKPDSIHYFHLFAVADRIDCSYLCDQKDFAPCDICVLMSRVLCEHVEFFKKNFEDIVDTHIKHEFYDEMSMKSITVTMEHFVNFRTRPMWLIVAKTPKNDVNASLPPAATSRSSSRAAPHRHQQQQQRCPHRQQQSCPHLQQQKQEHRRYLSQKPAGRMAKTSLPSIVHLFLLHTWVAQLFSSLGNTIANKTWFAPSSQG
eukprot:Em0004g140a